MVLVVYDENGNRMEFDTWQELQDYFDELEKKKGVDAIYRIIIATDPIPVDFE
jgi:enoyl-CoA hydratase/carnithine racemase